MGVAQTTRGRRFAWSSSPCFIESFLIHDVVRRDRHSGIAPRRFVSMRDRRHRIARAAPGNHNDVPISVRQPIESRSFFSEERSRAQSAISPDRTVVSRPRLWRVGFTRSQPTIPVRAGFRSKMALALCLSTTFYRRIAAGPPFRMTVSSAADATTARS